MTIAAISTAIGEAGIGIVRMSGNKSLEIANKVFKGNKVQELNDELNRKMTYGHIVDNDKVMDEVLIVYMKGPWTYTREDVVEIYCHGGIVPTRRVLKTLLENGAELAEAGEFTKRAFLNGRLDLSQAEAVMDMIDAKTDKSFEASFSQMEGSLSNKVDEIRETLLNMLAHVEASIDYPDESDVEDVAFEEVLNNSKEIKEVLEELIISSDRGKILRDGVSIAILGKPNVGKSSLLNAILRENRAIVTDIPGTTRDIIEEHINIDGIPIKLIDTAGIRETDDEVEQIGVSRAREITENADLLIAVFDVSNPLEDEDKEIVELIKDKKSLIILNKIDLENKYEEEEIKDIFEEKTIIETSMIENIGLSEIEESIKNMFFDGDITIDSDVMVTNMRHKNELEKALININDVIEAAKMQVPIDCIEVDLKSAWENLGKISGDTIEEDILDKIFSEFCLGK